MSKKKNKTQPSQESSNQNTSSNKLLFLGVGLIILFIIVIVSIFMFTNNNNSQPGTQQGNTQNGVQNPNPNNNPTVAGDVQVIRMSVEGHQYVPATLTVKVNQPVKWIVDATKASGCTSTIVASEFGIRSRLTKGENVFEFTPTRTGTFQFQCGMNMVQGKMIVVE